MYGELQKQKYVGDYIFKFKMIQERTTLLMNQRKQAGLEHRAVTDKMPFLACVEKVNTLGNFKLSDTEACDPDPWPMHAKYCMSLVDGYSRVICRFTDQ